jgi:hypothetical protein
MADQVPWHLSGDYFENCSCSIACPCLVSAAAPLTARPTMHPSGEMWVNIGHPVSPDRMVLAVGAAGNTFSDHGMRWDNSGRNGLYAPISWSNQA